MPSNAVPWMAWLVMGPLVAGLLALLFGRRAGVWLHLISAAMIILALVGLTVELMEFGPRRYPVGGWGAPLGIELYADGLSLLMLGMTAGIGTLVGMYASLYFRSEPHKMNLFWPLWLLLWTALNALFLSSDIFNFYVTLELVTLAAIPLIVLSGGTVVLNAGMRYLLFAMLGSLAFLLGVALLYGAFGTLDITQLGEQMTSVPTVWIAIALITTGLLAKAALFPLHVWLPSAHANAPAPVSALLSALVVKGSFYLLLRLWFWVFPVAITSAADQLLGLLGSGAIVYGSFQALRQTRLKLLVAYSTVAQLGYLMLIFPLAGALAWGGAVYQILSHGFAKAALFLAAGNVIHTLGHDRLVDLRGLSRTLPLTLYTFALAGIGIMGLPPSGGFLAKWLLLEACLDSSQWWWATVILVGGLLAAGYVFRILRCGFSLPAAGSHPHLPIVAGGSGPDALPRSLEIIPLLLALMAVGLGFLGTPSLALLEIGSPFAVQEIRP